MDLAQKYRPTRFEDIRGQDSVVKFLSQLIIRGQLGRNLLLHGTVGSGKTSLARLYAMALNCDSPAQSGSPCNSCKHCMLMEAKTAPDFYELDTSLRGGGADEIKGLIKELNRPPLYSRWRMIFMDEAHSLSHHAQDALLKVVEEPPPNVIYCLATTEPDEIKNALKSRLSLLRIRPLSAEGAIEFLQDFAAKEGYCWDAEGLALLAGLKQGYPRDLLQGLEHIGSIGAVTVDRVRVEFGVDYTCILLDYFRALAEGDFNRQVQIILDWQEPLQEKIRLIQLFLLSLYYNDLLDVRVTLDALVASIPSIERRPILIGFRDRLGVKEIRDLTAFWRTMMEFWPVAAADADDAALLLRLTLFHRLVSDFRAGSTAPFMDQSAVQPAPTPLPTPTRNPTQRPRRGPRSLPSSRPAYLSAEQVRDLFNRASYLTQEHGVLFNTQFVVRPRLFGVEDADKAAILISDFNRELSGRIRKWRNAELIRLMVFEHNEREGFRGLVAAYLPGLADIEKDVRRWCERWRHKTRSANPGDDPIGMTFCSPSAGEVDRVKFHWSRLRELCAGLDPKAKWRPESAREKPLRELVGLTSTKPRMAGVIGTQERTSASSALLPSTMAKACFLGMEPLSAFDDKAWTWIGRGWELKEHEDRRNLKRDREHEWMAAHASAGADQAARDEAAARLMAVWKKSPRERPRQWRGWWPRPEA